ncbi:GFA family protein [Pseudoprimorskyibacter insulae]|uniref:CENP-V/GFA domain-containing protein n=1 Tax=Pseudoprimorskyibacter insulae TaxID=1695997 RepID=A0A2R8AQ13_9RHOB|nr:GFA family protein [Pseudoprimorskyibacter insulae]SPF78070.1 hypothetical protein PRI8871_00659 [Pseudoprimorskyibacter insulae]
MTTRHLTCHCGTVELTLLMPPADLTTMRRCDCSFCRRRGAAAVSVPLAGLAVTKGAENLTLYQFGTNTARHYFCKTCGIYTHHQRRSNPLEYGVNLGALEGINPRDYDIGWVDGVNHPSDQTP